ncbi:crotonobetaine/carnitine-CoA ligase [Azospirillum fermentarium]|uniref:AMP-binding protein n=1 Tax=Azospirillum fermentarium TaxID=1233114 RepID=UPI0022274923|nr:AMP-binding protein [Azospirillum fermentarium]MCW2249268.1 crotonobetaine/carnitine-CoA ligase [Azospirillum fermentarium]
MSDMNPLSIAHLVAEKARIQPDLDVLTFENNGAEEVRTYSQLWNNGCRIAAALSARGVRKGDRFALLLQNHPEFVETMIAAAIVGAVFVPIDPRTRDAKLAFMLRDSGCVGAVCGDDASEALAGATASVPNLGWGIVVGDGPVFANSGGLHIEAMRNVLAAPARSLAIATDSETLPMQIMYTSGTTGDPKGVVVRHARFALVAGHGEAVFGYRPGDRPYTGLSLTHGNAQFVTLAPSLNMGLRAVFSRKFTKSRLWEVVRRYGCTSFSLLGGMITAIYSEPRRPDDADNPLRLVVSAGMPAAIWEDFARRFNVEITEFYGAMEGGMTINPAGQGPVGSCGRVAPGLVAKVVDEDGNEVPPGTPGEIWFRSADGSPAKVEYFNNPEAARLKTEGGWLHSGDVVIMDADGWVFFQCRKGGGIRRNGEFISPAFVEKVLAEHPAVDDVFVYGVPAESGAPGEHDVVAAVTPMDGCVLDPGELFEWCRTRLEPNMIPGFLQLLAELPKTASEKVQPRFLFERFRDDPNCVFRRPVSNAVKVA